MTIGELKEKLKNIPDSFNSINIKGHRHDGNISDGKDIGLVLGTDRGRWEKESDPKATFAFFGEVLGVEQPLKK